MKKYKIASVLMMIHGAFMEIGGLFIISSLEPPSKARKYGLIFQSISRSNSP